MDSEKLKSVIAEENEALERAAVAKARSLIQQIAGQQENIRAATEKVSDLKEELKKLSISSVDFATILG